MNQIKINTKPINFDMSIIVTDEVNNRPMRLYLHNAHIEIDQFGQPVIIEKINETDSKLYYFGGIPEEGKGSCHTFYKMYINKELNDHEQLEAEGYSEEPDDPETKYYKGYTSYLERNRDSDDDGSNDYDN